MRPQFAPFAMFGGLLAMAGLPIYIHAPKFYADEYGVSLAMLGAVLFGLRLLDVVQDPALGWLARRVAGVRKHAVAAATGLMALAMVCLFAIEPPTSPTLWFCLTLAALFSAYSFLTITFYAQGVATAKTLGQTAHIRLAGWRETGALLGVSLAAVAPVAFLSLTKAPFALFAGLFALIALAALFAMRQSWTTGNASQSRGLRPVLADPLASRLLLIALLNAMPVAVSSTLFLFFVESRLGAAGWEGPLLLLFFLAAAAAAPLWARTAERFGPKHTLMLAMVLAIAAFAWAALLGTGDTLAFAIICLASGAALGADMTLLPAMFAARVGQIAPEAAEGFGLWSFATKFSLAFAAALLLPLLDGFGFQPGSQTQPEQALYVLTLSYAVLPCVLKLGALLLLALTPMDSARGTALTKGTI